MKGKKIAVIGGDKRNRELFNLLQKDNNDVVLLGHDDEMSENEILVEINKAELVIGPLPLSVQDKYVNMPYRKSSIHLGDVFKAMNKNKLFTGGLISDEAMNLAKIYNIFCIDYYAREELQIMNAIPTCEGAIQLALENMPTTLFESKVLVLGYGRLGKVLCNSLKGLGAEVCCYARRLESRTWIEVNGCEPVNDIYLNDAISKADLIINTIPVLMFDTDRLLYLKDDALIIDLASKPGGVDFGRAEKLGIKCIWGLSLPGKVAPVTAALAIKRTIENIMKELGV